jgi:hypothetical protein
MFSETKLAVFVLDKRKKPLVPCSKKRARLLLTRGRAVVHRHYPLTIRLKDRIGGEVRPLLVKIDLGSKTIGIAVVTDEDGNKPAKVPCLFELLHRGRQISEALTARRAFNTTRWALYEALADTGLPVEALPGGRTKYDRSRYPEQPRTRRRLRWRSRDPRRLARRRVRLRRAGFAGSGLRPGPLSTLAFRRQSPAEVFDACCG